MKTLRFVVGIYVCLCIVIALALFHYAKEAWVGIYLLINAGIIVVGIMFEQAPYKPQHTSSKHTWQRTGERFIDPTTSKLMEVHYNPQTGERNYVEIKSK